MAVIPKEGGPFSLYCTECGCWVPNTANYEMRKESAFAYSHSCWDGNCLLMDGEIPNETWLEQQRVKELQKTGAKKDYRFQKRNAYVIGIEEFEAVMQELLDDATIRLETENAPYLSVYSSDSDTGYDHEEVLSRIINHTDKNIREGMYLPDTDEIVFICQVKAPET